MVMRKNAMRKNLSQSILKSFGRYLAIVMIIALGASMFVGLLMTKADMVATGQKHMDELNMFDLRLVSMYGWDKDHVRRIAAMEGVEDAEGITYVDLLAMYGSSEEAAAYRFYAMPEKMNQFLLVGGRMPERADECLVDGYHMDDSVLGKTVTVSADNEEASLDSVTEKTFTVVGYIASPLYMDMMRGTTTIGNGTLDNYFYVLPEALDLDYYTEINVTIPGDYKIYSDAYNDAMDAAAERIEPGVKELAQKRMMKYRNEAIEAYEKGLAEYEDGLRQFEEGKLQAEQELLDAENKLKNAEATLANSQKQLTDGEKQIEEAKKTIADGEKQLEEGKATLEQTKATAYEAVDNSIAVLNSELPEAEAELAAAEAVVADLNAQIDAISAQIAESEARYNALNEQINQLNWQIAALDTSITSTQASLNLAKLFPLINAELIASLEARLSEQTAQRAEADAQRQALIAERDPLQAELQEPMNQRSELQGQRSAAEIQRYTAEAAVNTIRYGLQELQDARALLDAQFAEAEAEILAGEAELEAGKKELAEQEKKLKDGWNAYYSGKQQLEDGWVEYEEGKLQMQRELDDAEKELADAIERLNEAKEVIDSMQDATVFILDRNSNVGYNSLNSSSDIVQGVSRVFPVFFLLVAALVCITTMTRMIDEERTQIGTLKALGYSNRAIISKYLFYAGSGAVLGCGIGVVVGSVAFPTILWEAYKIMLHISDRIVLEFNWALCAIVVGAYTSVMLFVTWYCCRRALQEVPAELIRPKAPDAGKKILLEYLPFWRRISFLNKVTIRNIFRYRQRLAMMMVGIGGCTALLVAGFGLRDSIVNVVDYQFTDVTTYDMTVYFMDGQSEEEQQDFLKDVAYAAEHAMFYHQSSMDLDFNNQVRKISLIASTEDVRDFIDFHTGEEKLPYPGINEVLLSVGAAEMMGIRVGDEISMRNADMQTLKLKVSGIYDNHVDNFALIHPDTIERQWGKVPEMQMAFVTVKEGADLDQLSGKISGMSDVMNISISEDFANMVSNMMDALDLVVVVVVVCAGLLAATVLYNLTNININERIREIATIKVLGFNAKETALYVFKENLSLTVIGSALGLGLGYFLLLFIMSQIKLDMVWFKAIISPVSYGIAIVLTILAAIIVDFVFYFKLDKINMAEALKSVE